MRYVGGLPRFGVLLSINGTGNMNSWIHKLFADTTFGKMNIQAMMVPPGSDGLMAFPFGKEVGAEISGIDFNKHSRGHMYRAVQEGIAFAFRYGIDC